MHFLCRSTLDAMGIQEDVMELFQALRMDVFILHHWDGYSHLACEFLSSVEVATSMDEDAQGGTISFRLINKSYKWRIHEFNEFFSLHPGGNSHSAAIWTEDGFDATAMHCDLTGKHTFEAR